MEAALNNVLTLAPNRTETARQTLEKFLQRDDLDEMTNLLIIGAKPCPDGDKRHSRFVIGYPDNRTEKDILWDLEVFKAAILG
jgi:hypothetical protein